MTDENGAYGVFSPTVRRWVEGLLNDDPAVVAEVRQALADDEVTQDECRVRWPGGAEVEAAMDALDAERRPFCNTWPYPVSDLDLVLPEANDKVHKARGCCDGWLPRPDANGTEGVK